MTAYEMLNVEPAVLANLPVWGCRVWVHDTGVGKLGARAKEGWRIGFDVNSNIRSSGLLAGLMNSKFQCFTS
ncbi:hypothetical protein M378DRAFT_174287 [Amanita muscaria Koide BX008]|uniref:Uncharacterized protein n=1 Tax=Amanita muscaria (strain Koide BX008) TaxID=946122 RepID=A0A0C2RVV4_AMAMK|nr:hypothetical protein M378DRAFT_174287 [Amanita muscaria Koide BX008]